jgi:hypothetical protein
MCWPRGAVRDCHTIEAAREAHLHLAGYARRSPRARPADRLGNAVRDGASLGTSTRRSFLVIPARRHGDDRCRIRYRRMAVPDIRRAASRQSIRSHTYGRMASMPVLDNPRHERFAQEVAQGTSQREAYKIAGYSVKNDASADASASRLLSGAIISSKSCRQFLLVPLKKPA